jgi:hypothetical protein
VGRRPLVLAKRVCRFDDNVNIHATRFCVDSGKIRSTALAKARA